ncbi:10721_t:CDS:2, partial [Racocetra fulgida]
LKDSGQKHEKTIQDAEQALEKAKTKYETHSEDWERTILQKSGDISNIKPRTSLTKAIFSKQPKSPTQALKDISDECDIGIQYHLARYTYLFENTMVSDALVISPANTEDDNHEIPLILIKCAEEIEKNGGKAVKKENAETVDLSAEECSSDNQEKNKMNVQNLGIVFGPTLMGSPIVTAISNPVSSSGLSLQNSNTALSSPLSHVSDSGGGLNDMGIIPNLLIYGNFLI